jgi:hypothetical protein
MVPTSGEAFRVAGSDIERGEKAAERAQAGGAELEAIAARISACHIERGLGRGRGTHRPWRVLISACPKIARNDAERPRRRPGYRYVSQKCAGDRRQRTCHRPWVVTLKYLRASSAFPPILQTPQGSDLCNRRRLRCFLH